jgi:hypothetical protein
MTFWFIAQCLNHCATMCPQWRRMAGKSIEQRGLEEAPENGKESLHSALANLMNE